MRETVSPADELRSGRGHPSSTGHKGGKYQDMWHASCSLSCLPGDMGPSCHPNASPHTQEETAYGKRIRASLPGPSPTPRLGHAHGLLASASFPGHDLVAGSRSLTSCTGPGRTPGGVTL